MGAMRTGLDAGGGPNRCQAAPLSRGLAWVAKLAISERVAVATTVPREAVS